MSGYVTRLLAGNVQPQRAVRPLLGSLFGQPSAGPEWLLRENRPGQAPSQDGHAGAVPETARLFGDAAVDAAVRDDSPAVMRAPSPRFVAADSAPAAGEGALERQPVLTRASNEEEEPKRLHPRVHERELERAHEPRRGQVAAPRDLTQEDAAPDDRAVAPALDRWRSRRPSTETPPFDQAPAEAAPVAGSYTERRSAALTPPAGQGSMTGSKPAFSRIERPRIARLPLHRDGDIGLIRRYASHRDHSSPPPGAKPDHDALPAPIAEATAAAEVMAVAMRWALPAESPVGRDAEPLGAVAHRAGSAAPEPAQRSGVESRHAVENRYGKELRRDAEMRRADPEPTVHVTIGTVEIKAAVRSNPPRPRPASPAAPRVGLDEYLRRRRTGDPS